MRIRNSVLLFLAIYCLTGCFQRPAEEQSEVVRYGTWPSWEVDRAASIWLMKRYVNTEAEFVFVEKGMPMGDLVSFDVPESEYRRTHKLACYQVVLQKHGVTNTVLHDLGRLVWDVEVNFWGDKKYPETLAFKRQIDDIFDLELSDDETLQRCFVIFDKYAAEKEL